MNPYNKHCAFEQSKALVELGVTQSAESTYSAHATLYEGPGKIPAYDVSELGVMLGLEINRQQAQLHKDGVVFTYDFGDYKKIAPVYKSQAESYAALLIDCLNVNLISAQEANERLKAA